MESRTQRSKLRPMIQKNPRPRPKTDFSRPRTGMLKAKNTRRRCSPKRKKRSLREEMPISKVKRKKLMAIAHFQQFNVLGREQGIFEDLQASRPRTLPSKDFKMCPRGLRLCYLGFLAAIFNAKNCSANVAFSQIT